MRLVHVLVGSNKAALENREEAFQHVGMHVAARPLELRVIDRLVIADLELVHLRAVGDQAAVLVQILKNCLSHVFVIEVHGADVAAALDQGEHLRRGASAVRQARVFAGLGGLREIRFVGLDGLAFAAQESGIGSRGHRQADAVAYVPCGTHGTAQHPLQLADRDTFLAGAHQIDRLKPVRHRDMAVLENGLHLDRKWSSAFVAFTQADTRGLALELRDAGLVAVTAVRAHGAIRPKLRLYVFVGSLFVAKFRSIEVRVHGRNRTRCAVVWQR